MPKLNRELGWFLEFSLIAIFSILFWSIKGFWDGSGFGTDMNRYFSQFLVLSKDPLVIFQYILQSLKDPMAIIIPYIFKIIGFSFNFFLLLIIYFYYKVASDRIKIVLGFQTFYLQIIVLSMYSIWLISLVGVILRQGISLLVVLAFMFKLKNKNIFSRNLIQDLTAVSIACLLHLSNIIIVPYLFIRGFLKKYLFLFNILFYFIFVLYIFSIFVPLKPFLLSILGNWFQLLIRAMSYESNYVVGPTLTKALAILVPVLITDIFSKYYTLNQKYQIEPIILFYKYISIIGMLLSGFPYYDRLLIISWIFSPIILILPFNIFSKTILKPYYRKV
tara:strand:+ start:2279 stop:3277 length:999 start_codon:yes stop_codon:yes gene_type:complete